MVACGFEPRRVGSTVCDSFPFFVCHPDSPWSDSGCLRWCVSSLEESLQQLDPVSPAGPLRCCAQRFLYRRAPRPSPGRTLSSLSSDSDVCGVDGVGVRVGERRSGGGRRRVLFGPLGAESPDSPPSSGTVSGFCFALCSPAPLPCPFASSCLPSPSLLWALQTPQGSWPHM